MDWKFFTMYNMIQCHSSLFSSNFYFFVSLLKECPRGFVLCMFSVQEILLVNYLPSNNVYVWTLNNALIFFIIALFFFIFWFGKFRIWYLFLELASPTLLCLLFSCFIASLLNRTPWVTLYLWTVCSLLFVLCYLMLPWERLKWASLFCLMLNPFCFRAYAWTAWYFLVSIIP